MLKERETTSPPCGAGGGAGGGDPPAAGGGAAGAATDTVQGGGSGGGPGAALCSGCGGRIADRYYLLAVDRQWHSSCLRCSECRVTLASEQTCFSRGGHIFCKEDYYRMFSVKRCARCQLAISSSELVMRARELVFHLHCFTCATCGTALARGDQFGVSPASPAGGCPGNGAGGARPASWQAYCRPHFEQLLAACCEGHPGLAHGLAQGLTLGDSPTGSPYYHHGGDPGPAGSLGGAGSLSAVGIVGAVQKGRPRKRKLTPVAPVSPLPLGAELSHHQHLAMRLSAQALEMVGKGDLSSGCASVDSLGYDSGMMPQDLSSGMESLSYDCGAGSPGSLSVQGQQRTKRMRTSFKHHQLRTMKSYFAVNQNPDAKDLKQLAQKTGLSKRVLQVWFQNARAKWRRNMMRQENGQPSGGPHGGGGGGAGPGGGSGGNPGGPGGGGLGMSEASLEELHHHHAHHLVHPGGPGPALGHSPLSTAPLSLADLY